MKILRNCRDNAVNNPITTISFDQREWGNTEFPSITPAQNQKFSTPNTTLTAYVINGSLHNLSTSSMGIIEKLQNEGMMWQNAKGTWVIM